MYELLSLRALFLNSWSICSFDPWTWLLARSRRLSLSPRLGARISKPSRKHSPIRNISIFYGSASVAMMETRSVSLQSYRKGLYSYSTNLLILAWAERFVTLLTILFSRLTTTNYRKSLENRRKIFGIGSGAWRIILKICKSAATERLERMTLPWKKSRKRKTVWRKRLSGAWQILRTKPDGSFCWKADDNVTYNVRIERSWAEHGRLYLVQESVYADRELNWIPILFLLSPEFSHPLYCLIVFFLRASLTHCSTFANSEFSRPVVYESFNLRRQVLSFFQRFSLSWISSF